MTILLFLILAPLAILLTVLVLTHTAAVLAICDRRRADRMSDPRNGDRRGCPAPRLWAEHAPALLTLLHDAVATTRAAAAADADTDVAPELETGTERGTTTATSQARRRPERRRREAVW